MKKYLLAGAAASTASFGSFAADYTSSITAAQTDATGNQTAVIAAVIAVAVISFGATALVSWLRK